MPDIPVQWDGPLFLYQQTQTALGLQQMVALGAHYGLDLNISTVLAIFLDIPLYGCHTSPSLSEDFIQA